MRLSILSLVSTCLVAPAFAAEPTPITVVATIEDYSPDSDAATRTNTADNLVPFISQSVGNALIEDRGLNNLQDALRSVPGTAPVTGIGGFNTRFRLRGFVSTNNLRNGARQALAFPLTELANVQRIEVLKGPASALYGRARLTL
jgi:iron complex outermembrane recepter protein